MKQVSQKQIQANKNNAKLGGVKTQQGKEVTRFNALQHGILRTSISEYEKFDYESLFDSLKQGFTPQNTLEEILVERIAISYVKFLRVSKAEVEFIKETMSPNGSVLLFPEHKYESELSVNGFEKLANIYTRYETSVENRFYKAINKLIDL
jgi:hypothetical protein